MKIATYSLQLLVAVVFLAAVESVTAGNLEPSASPGPTMKTLDEVLPTWSQILPSNDGEANGCNSSRFKCVMGGNAVLDLETGLVWERSPSSIRKNFREVKSYCFNSYIGNRRGWRLPLIEELSSLIDSAETNPALASGHPFLNVQSSFYWSLTNGLPFCATCQLGVNFKDAASNINSEYPVIISGAGPSDSNLQYSWCVRGGTGYDGRQF